MTENSKNGMLESKFRDNAGQFFYSGFFACDTGAETDI